MEAAADHLRRETNLVKRYESIKPLHAVMRFAYVSAFILADVHDRGYYPRRGIEILSLSTAPCARVLGHILFQDIREYFRLCGDLGSS